MSEHASLRGIHLAYERFGDSGTPVVLIMGFGMAGAAWRGQAALLSVQHRVVTFDNRGAGRTESQPGVHSMQMYADDTAALLDHVGFERAHVVGVSMGGMIAQELVLRHRTRARSLTLIATHAGGLRSVVPPLRGLQLFLKAQRGNDPTARYAAVEELLFPQSYLSSCDRQVLRDVISSDFGCPSPQKQRLSQLSAVMQHRTASRLKSLLGLPTLVIQPSHDLLIHPRESERLARLIPGARLVRYEETGHGIIRQHAQKLSEDLLAHFAAAEAGLPEDRGLLANELRSTEAR